MKLFIFTFGHDTKYGAFEDKEAAYEQRATVDPIYEWTPVQIDEVTVEGYAITATPLNATEEATPSKRKRAGS